MAPSITVFPKSPSARTNTIITAATGTMGMSRPRQVSSRRDRRERTSAPQTTNASFAISLGWSLNGPKISIQLRCPPTSTPMMRTATSNPKATSSNGHAKARQNCTDVRAAKNIATTPRSAKKAWRCARV